MSSPLSVSAPLSYLRDPIVPFLVVELRRLSAFMRRRISSTTISQCLRCTGTRRRSTTSTRPNAGTHHTHETRRRVQAAHTPTLTELQPPALALRIQPGPRHGGREQDGDLFWFGFAAKRHVLQESTVDDSESPRVASSKTQGVLARNCTGSLGAWPRIATHIEAVQELVVPQVAVVFVAQKYSLTFHAHRGKHAHLNLPMHTREAPRSHVPRRQG